MMTQTEWNALRCAGCGGGFTVDRIPEFRLDGEPTHHDCVPLQDYGSSKGPKATNVSRAAREESVEAHRYDAFSLYIDSRS